MEYREDAITSFRDEYRFLSNFFPAPVTYDGLTYANAEAAFQAQKCLERRDREAFCAMDPGQAKRHGRRVQLRPDWEQVKVGLMAQIVRAKFEQTPLLASQLLATGDRPLVEGNTWNDRCWGVDLRTGKGENHLGRILMDVRAALRQEMERED